PDRGAARLRRDRGAAGRAGRAAADPRRRGADARRSTGARRLMDFAALAGGYDELRPAGESWRELAAVELAELGPAARLLDVGCGTGRFAVFAAERLGARVWGVDPSSEMLDQARRRGARGVGWKQAAAEHLPFKDGWFDAAHAHLVMHVVDDVGAALSEIARVLCPGGRLVVVSFRREHFDRFHLNPYFPTLAGIDRVRIPQRWPRPSVEPGSRTWPNGACTSG